METIAFVVGATGYTGRAVIAELRSRDIKTIAHIRPESSQRDLWTERWQASGVDIDTSPWDSETLSVSLAQHKPTVLFSLLGTTQSRMKKAAAQGSDPTRQSYEHVDYGLTALLMDAALKAGSNPKFIYLSSAGVKAGSRSPYLAVRWKAEEKLRTLGLPYLIARPSFITGPDRDEFRLGERLGAATGDVVLAGLALFGARKLRQRYRSTTGHILAKALVDAALDSERVNLLLESESLRNNRL